METKKDIWPCVMCTAQEYEQIREKLLKLGYTDRNGYNILNWDEYPFLQTKYKSSYERSIGNWVSINEAGQYLCPDIDTFLHDCREIAISNGWFKEEVIVEKETATEKAEEKLDQENKVDNPRTCIFYRCDPSEIFSVTMKLMEMGFWTGSLSNLNDNNTVFEVICEHIGVFSRCHSHTKSQFPEIECKTKDEFLQKVEESIPRVITTERKDAGDEETVDTTEEVNQESDRSEKVEEAREDAAHTVAYTLDPWLETVARNNEEKIRRLVELGVLDTPENTAVRGHNIGASDYAKHIFQPWVAWQEYNLDPWDADIVKRVLRDKAGESRILDYEKIKHICDEKIRQLKMK